MFVFGGREPNLELALPYYERILDRHDNVEIHLWDLTQRDKTGADHKYMKSIPTSDRFQVRTEFYKTTITTSRAQNLVWAHYAQPEYRGTTFVKCDDDDVFYDTNRFNDFVDAIRPDDVLSALTINHGASTPFIPELWDMYTELKDVPALPDWKCGTGPVHLSGEYAVRSHRWFFQSWRALTSTSGEPVPVGDDWVSINCTGFQWETCTKISQLIGTPHPRRVAGRTFRRGPVGDEGASNILPRRIHTGFVVGHLNYGPQIAQIDAATYTDLRKQYADVGRQYLCDNTTQVGLNT